MGVFSEIKPTNHARKNPFDLGCYRSYNTKVGLALPLKFWPTLPSSEYELDLKALLRTQPLATAAFAGFSINYDVVWTPYNDHYSSFNQFIAQRLNKQHTTQPDISQIPHFDLGHFVIWLIAHAVYDYFGAMTTEEELEFLYNKQSVEVNVRRYLYFSKHLPEESMVLSAIRTLDLLEYGNFLPVVKAICSALMDIMDNATYDSASDKQLPYVVRYAAMLDTTKYSASTNTFLSDFVGFAPVWDSEKFAFEFLDLFAESIYLEKYGVNLHNLLPSDVSYSLWPVMCYNKAFWQFYRNEYYDIRYEFFNVYQGQYQDRDIPYVNMFNMDDISTTLDCGDPQTFNWQTFERLISMFAVKPHQYKKDRFTGLLPSTQYGSVSVASSDDVFYRIIGNTVSSGTVPSLSSSNRDLYVAQSTNATTSSMAGAQFSNSYSDVRSDKFKFDPTPMISVLELRRADALQRFRERMLRAGNKTKDIFKAHGWEEPMSESAFEVQFFGNFDGRLDLNVVASTTDTEEVNLGQLAANGVGVIGGSKVRFKSHDFGTLLIIAYITKDAVYDAYGVAKSHMLLEPFDFPYPELQNVSLSPITKDELTVFGNGLTWKNNTVGLGYLPQNMAYKTQNDLVHGEFFSSNPFYQTNTQDQEKLISPIGIFANMVTPRLDISNPTSLSFFYLQPSCADNIFKVNANGNQDTDQFFGNIRFDLKAVQPLDVIGLPI